MAKPRLLAENLVPLKCPRCRSEHVSIQRPLWVDFFEDGRRAVDELDLEEAKPERGDSALCRECGLSWAYGRPRRRSAAAAPSRSLHTARPSGP